MLPPIPITSQIVMQNTIIIIQKKFIQNLLFSYLHRILVNICQEIVLVAVLGKNYSIIIQNIVIIIWKKMFHNLIFPYRNRILEIVLVFQFKTLFQEDGNGRLPLSKNNIIIENKIYKYSLNKCKYIHIYMYTNVHMH